MMQHYHYNYHFHSHHHHHHHHFQFLHHYLLVVANSFVLLDKINFAFCHLLHLYVLHVFLNLVPHLTQIPYLHNYDCYHYYYCHKRTLHLIVIHVMMMTMTMVYFVRLRVIDSIVSIPPFHEP